MRLNGRSAPYFGYAVRTGHSGFGSVVEAVSSAFRYAVYHALDVATWLIWRSFISYARVSSFGFGLIAAIVDDAVRENTTDGSEKNAIHVSTRAIAKTQQMPATKMYCGSALRLVMHRIRALWHVLYDVRSSRMRARTAWTLTAHDDAERDDAHSENDEEY